MVNLAPLELFIYETFLSGKQTPRGTPLAHLKNPTHFLKALEVFFQINKDNMLRIVFKKKEKENVFLKKLDGKILNWETGEVVTLEGLLSSL